MIKPCPFCGGMFKIQKGRMLWMTYYHAFCMTCGVMFPDEFDTEEDAAIKINQRCWGGREVKP